MTAPQIIAGRYVMQDLIGQGGMGKVYRGLDLQTATPVAVKHLRADVLGDDPAIVERFTREGEALRQLNHPNIVKMLASVNDQNGHYLVMEYVGGGSLVEILRKQPRMSVQRVMYIALDLADALTRAHRLNIIHRDIKPDNVLLAEDGTPRLTDFGVARIGAEPQITRSDSVIGTYAYLSPEAFSSAEPDARTDIWAFGVMLYEMLAGHRPFHKDELSSLIMAIMTEPLPDLQQQRPDVPVGLIDLINRMLEKDPDRRMSSVRLIGAELEAIINGKDLSTPAIVIPAEPRFETPTPQPHNHYHNLPVQVTLLLGRDSEMERLHELLDQNRLVTILGPGGMGKTRLSIAAAEAHLEHSPDGVYFVPLAPLTSPEGIVPAIAEALKFSFYDEQNTRGQMLDHLRNKELLLVLDNFEHVIGGADIVSDILTSASRVQILVTSRERLNLTSEVLFPIQGLPFPTTDARTDTSLEEFPAVRLFAQSAARLQPGFTLDKQNRTAIAEITRLVQGMPLGIELAAAWTDALSPQEIVEEIGRSLDFLETSMRDVPERHRSIRAVFEYSWNTMTPDERDAFQQLAVFRGAFGRDAAQKVSNASLRTLTNLVNKSLLKRDTAGRYEVHELLRQYAEERLSSDPAVATAARDRHSSYYAEFLHKLGPQLKDQRQISAIREISAEIQNVRAAWRWMLDNLRMDALSQAMEALWLFYEIRGWFREGLEMFSEATHQCEECTLDSRINGSPEHRVIVARARARQGWFAGRMGKTTKALKLIQQSISILEQDHTPEALAFSYLALGTSDGEETMPRPAMREFFEKALAIYRTTNNRWGIAHALYQIGRIYRIDFEMNQDYSVGVRSLQEALKIQREIGDQYGIAATLAVMAIIAAWSNRSDDAESMVDEALSINRDLGSDSGVSATLLAMGVTAESRGDLHAADKYFRESLEVRRQIGNLPAVATLLGFIAWNAYMTGNYSEAMRLGDESLHVFRNTELAENSVPGFMFGQAHVWVALGEYDRAIAQLETALSMIAAREFDLRIRFDLMFGHTYLLKGDYDRAAQYLERNLNSSMAAESGENIGNAYDRLGRLAFAQSDYSRARTLYTQSLDAQKMVSNRWGIAEAYNGLGEVAFVDGQLDTARKHFLDALAYGVTTGVAFVLLRALAGLALVAAQQGDRAQAVELGTFVVEHPGTWADLRPALRSQLNALAGLMPEVEYNAAAARGRSHDLLTLVRDLTPVITAVPASLPRTNP